MPDEGAEPLDPLWIETVGGFVQYEDLRIAQQCGGQLEPLAHAHRELAHSPPGHVGQADQFEGLSHPGERKTRSDGHHLEVVIGPPSGVETGRFQHGSYVVNRLIDVDVPTSCESRCSAGPGHKP